MRYTNVRIPRQGTWVTSGSRHERDPNLFSPVYAKRRKRFIITCNVFKQRKFLLNANITLLHNQIRSIKKFLFDNI